MQSRSNAMCTIQEKITRHANKQENVVHDKKKNHPIETDPKMTEVMQLGGKNCKRAMMCSIIEGET